MLRNRWFLALAIVLGVVLLFYPLAQKLRQLEKEQQALQQTLAQGRTATQKIREITEREAEVKSQLAADKDLAVILQELSALIDAEVSLLRFSPKPTAQVGELAVLPLTVELSGSYPALLRTISLLGEQTLWVLRACALKESKGPLTATIQLWVPWGDGL